MYFGVDYYPEQWEPGMLDEDLDRIVEFAWHLMEPEKGKFDFSFFDRVIAAAGKRGLSVIFGTPTAAPPAWLAHAHPDILSQSETGVPRAYGGRHVACYSSEPYLERCRAIVTALAEHYRDERCIVAWQIDNELGHEGSDKCWCPRCRKKFQSFLSRKFGGDIAALNGAYGTAFWSQEYNFFEEIPLPAPTITVHNPALRLDWERFCSENIRAFAEEQCDIIRRIIPNAFIIHDFPGGGLTKSVDYAAISALLDKAAYNNYPVWGGQKEPLPPEEIAFGLDYIRGLKGESFWITEAIMGAQGHDITGCLPRPGQAKLWSWQAMVHGCDGLLYFRYRGAAKGAEQFCYGLLDPDNVPRRRFFEAQSFFSEVRQLETALSAPLRAETAILYDYDSLASFRIQRQSPLLDTEREMKRLHGILYHRGVGVDVIPASRDFSAYKMVIVPNMAVTDPEFAARLKAYVAAGGTALVTFRTAVKDRDNNLVFGKSLPVDLNDLLGLYVEETESVQELDSIPIAGEYGTGRAGVFRDMIVPEGAQVLWRYDDEFYRRYAAITRCDYGRGTAYYLGAVPDPYVLDTLFDEVMSRASIERLDLPKGVECVVRGEGSERVRILMNHNSYPVAAMGRELGPFAVEVVPS